MDHHSSEKEEGELSSDDEYQSKFSEMQTYIPFLQQMIQRLEQSNDKSREAQLSKMKSLYGILNNTKKKLKVETLKRCEDVLRNLMNKVEKWKLTQNAGHKETGKSKKRHKEMSKNSNASVLKKSLADERTSSETGNKSDEEKTADHEAIVSSTTQAGETENGSEVVKVLTLAAARKNLRNKIDHETPSASSHQAREDVKNKVSSSSSPYLVTSTSPTKLAPAERSETSSKDVLEQSRERLKKLMGRHFPSTPPSEQSPSDSISLPRSVDTLSPQGDWVYSKESWDHCSAPVGSDSCDEELFTRRGNHAEDDTKLHASQAVKSVSPKSDASPREDSLRIRSMHKKEHLSRSPPLKSRTKVFSPERSSDESERESGGSGSRRIRAKLEQEITKVHRVGVSTGGALRSLMAKDDRERVSKGHCDSDRRTEHPSSRRRASGGEDSSQSPPVRRRSSGETVRRTTSNTSSVLSLSSPRSPMPSPTSVAPSVPTSVPAPVSATSPVAAPKGVAVPLPVPAPALVPLPVPAPAMVPLPVPAPAMVPLPVPAPAMVPLPVPAPGMVPLPVPAPVPAPVPPPTLASPTPVLTGVPNVTPVPVPAPDLVGSPIPVLCQRTYNKADNKSSGGILTNMSHEELQRIVSENLRNLPSPPPITKEILESVKNSPCGLTWKPPLSSSNKCISSEPVSTPASPDEAYSAATYPSVGGAGSSHNAFHTPSVSQRKGIYDNALPGILSLEDSRFYQSLEEQRASSVQTHQPALDSRRNSVYGHHSTEDPRINSHRGHHTVEDHRLGGGGYGSVETRVVCYDHQSLDANGLALAQQTLSQPHQQVQLQSHLQPHSQLHSQSHSQRPQCHTQLPAQSHIQPHTSSHIQAHGQQLYQPHSQPHGTSHVQTHAQALGHPHAQSHSQMLTEGDRRGAVIEDPRYGGPAYPQGRKEDPRGQPGERRRGLLPTPPRCEKYYAPPSSSRSHVQDLAGKFDSRQGITDYHMLGDYQQNSMISPGSHSWEQRGWSGGVSQCMRDSRIPADDQFHSIPAAYCYNMWNEGRSRVSDQRLQKGEAVESQSDPRGEPRSDVRVDPRCESRDPRGQRKPVSLLSLQIQQPPRTSIGASERDPRRRPEEETRVPEERRRKSEPWGTTQLPDSSKRSSFKDRERQREEKRRVGSVDVEDKKDSKGADVKAAEVSSPLEYLYGTVVPKTGKGYGFQNFRIPKIKRDVPKSTILRPPTPPRPASSRDESPPPSEAADSVDGEAKSAVVEGGTSENIEEEATSTTVAVPSDTHEPEQKELKQEHAEVTQEHKQVTHEHKEQKEVTQELIESLIRKSFETGEGKKLFEHARFFEKLSASLKAKKFKKIRRILESESDTDSEAKMETQDTKEDSSPEKQLKSKVRVLVDSSDSDDVPLASKLMRKKKPLIKKGKLTEKEDIEKIDLHVEVEEEGKDVKKTEPETGELQKNIKKPAAKRRNALELLQQDIRDMFIREGVVTATGYRMCRLLKEAQSGISLDEITKNEAKRMEDEADGESDSSSVAGKVDKKPKGSTKAKKQSAAKANKKTSKNSESEALSDNESSQTRPKQKQNIEDTDSDSSFGYRSSKSRVSGPRGIEWERKEVVKRRRVPRVVLEKTDVSKLRSASCRSHIDSDEECVDESDETRKKCNVRKIVAKKPNSKKGGKKELDATEIEEIFFTREPYLFKKKRVKCRYFLDRKVENAIKVLKNYRCSNISLAELFPPPITMHSSLKLEREPHNEDVKDIELSTITSDTECHETDEKSLPVYEESSLKNNMKEIVSSQKPPIKLNLIKKRYTQKKKKVSKWKLGIIKKKSNAHRFKAGYVIHRNSMTEESTPTSKRYPVNEEADLMAIEDVDSDKIEHFESSDGVQLKENQSVQESSQASLNEITGDVVKNEIQFDDVHYSFNGKSKQTNCLLCSYEGKFIVQHYKQVHPYNEVLISRLPLDEAARAKTESAEKGYNDESFCVDIMGNRKVPSAFVCRFCNYNAQYAVNFYEHVSSHTGEYRYQCCKCPYTSASRTTFKGHFYNHHPKNRLKQGLNLKVLTEGPSNNTKVIFGFLCSKCNFVQLLQENIEKHIALRHGESEDTRAIRINMSKPSNIVIQEDLEEMDNGADNSVSDEETDISSISTGRHSVSLGEKSKVDEDQEDEVNEKDSVVRLVSHEDHSTSAKSISSEGETLNEVRKTTLKEKKPNLMEAFIPVSMEVNDNECVILEERVKQMKDIIDAVKFDDVIKKFNDIIQQDEDIIVLLENKIKHIKVEIGEDEDEGMVESPSMEDINLKIQNVKKENQPEGCTEKEDTLEKDKVCENHEAESFGKTNITPVTDEESVEKSVSDDQLTLAPPAPSQNKVANSEELGERRITRSLSRTDEDGRSNMSDDSGCESSNYEVIEITDESDVDEDDSGNEAAVEEARELPSADAPCNLIHRLVARVEATAIGAGPPPAAAPLRPPPAAASAPRPSSTTSKVRVASLEARLLSDGATLLCCLLPSCVFTTATFAVMEKHLARAHKPVWWDGICASCDDRRVFGVDKDSESSSVSREHKYPLSFALEHLRKVHLSALEVAKESFTSASSSPTRESPTPMDTSSPMEAALPMEAATPMETELVMESSVSESSSTESGVPDVLTDLAEEPVPKEESEPLKPKTYIRMRRLSGDKLSSPALAPASLPAEPTPDNSATIVSTEGESNIITNTEDDDLPFLKIESVVSLHPGASSNVDETFFGVSSASTPSPSPIKDTTTLSTHRTVCELSSNRNLTSPVLKIARKIVTLTGTSPVKATQLQILPFTQTSVLGSASSKTSAPTPPVVSTSTSGLPPPLINLAQLVRPTGRSSRLSVTPILPKLLPRPSLQAVVVTATETSPSSAIPGPSVVIPSISSVTAVACPSTSTTNTQPAAVPVSLAVSSIATSSSGKKSSLNFMSAGSARTSLFKYHRLQQAPAPHLNSTRQKLSHKNSKTFEQAKAAKSPSVYQRMVRHDKLRHLFKCMAKQCTFTTDIARIFEEHSLRHAYLFHNLRTKLPRIRGKGGCKGEDMRRIETGCWPQCSYCCTLHNSPSDLSKHIQEYHGQSLYQCAYCFFRAISYSYVLLHQNTNHTQMKITVLLCHKLENILPAANTIRPRFDVVLPYQCAQGGCGMTFLNPASFWRHLENAHANMTCYFCHMCVGQYMKPENLLMHYKLHSLCVYQCQYCLHGADTREDMRHHLCNFHPNQKPCVIMRDSDPNMPATGSEVERKIDQLQEIDVEDELVREGLLFPPAPPCSEGEEDPESFWRSYVSFTLEYPNLDVGDWNLLRQVEMPPTDGIFAPKSHLRKLRGSASSLPETSLLQLTDSISTGSAEEAGISESGQDILLESASGVGNDSTSECVEGEDSTVSHADVALCLEDSNLECPSALNNDNSLACNTQVSSDEDTTTSNSEDPGASISMSRKNEASNTKSSKSSSKHVGAKAKKVNSDIIVIEDGSDVDQTTSHIGKGRQKSREPWVDKTLAPLCSDGNDSDVMIIGSDDETFPSKKAKTNFHIPLDESDPNYEPIVTLASRSTTIATDPLAMEVQIPQNLNSSVGTPDSKISLQTKLSVVSPQKLVLNTESEKEIVKEKNTESSAGSTENVSSLNRVSGASPSKLATNEIQMEIESPTVSAGSSSKDSSIDPAILTHATISDEDLEKTGASKERLYRCGNTTCTYAAVNASLLRDHLVICDLSRESVGLTCTHCLRQFKQATPYLEHLKHHGTCRYSCFICKFRSPLPQQVIKHLKQKHRIYNSITVPVNPQNNDPETGLFVVCSKDKTRPKAVPHFRNKRNFNPDEVNFLPVKYISFHPLTCNVCNFRSKVIGNMRRHLNFHNNKDMNPREIPANDPVNPVPCLEKKEMMFDKMTNLAASSHPLGRMGAKPASGSPGAAIAEQLKQLPKYVPENERYVCGSMGCSYLTCDEAMLRCHMRALHCEEASYRCPHCPALREPVLMERLGSHLRMHDSRLYKCAHCTYFHFQRHIVERHLADRHPEKRPFVQVVREDGEATAPANPSVSATASGTTTTVWKCGICYMQFPTRAELTDHTSSTHNVKSAFQCGLCSFKSSSRLNSQAHFHTRHPGEEYNVIHVCQRIIVPLAASTGPGTVSSPHTGASLSTVSSPCASPAPFESPVPTPPEPPPKRFDTTPLWLRNMVRIRHIRGVLLEDEEETRHHLQQLEEGGRKQRKVDSGNLTPSFIPPSTTTVLERDILEDLFGPYGAPVNGNHFFCTLCCKYKTRFKCDMKEHLYRELNYVKWMCKHCNLTSSSRYQIQKHSKMHEKENKPEKIVTLQANNNLECWVDRLLAKQQHDMKGVPDVVPAKSIATAISKAISKAKGSPAVPASTSISSPQSSLKTGATTNPNIKLNSPSSKSVANFSEDCLPPGEAQASPIVHSTKRKLSLATGDWDTEEENPSKRGNTAESRSVNSELSENTDTTVPEKSPEKQSPEDKKKGGSKDQFICKDCNAGFAAVRGLKLHIRFVHLRLGSYSCGYCGQTGYSESSVRQHCKNFHASRPEIINHVKDTSKVKINDEFWEREYGIKPPKTDEGSAAKRPRPSLDSSVTLPAGTEAAEGDDILVISEVSLKCTHCTYRCKSSSDLRNHEKRHWVQKPYVCGLCGFEGVREYEVKKHAAKVHPGLPLQVEERTLPAEPEIKPLQRPRRVREDQASGMASSTSVVGSDEVAPKLAKGEQSEGRGMSDEADVPGETEKSSTEHIGDNEDKKMFRCFYCPLRATSLGIVHTHWEKMHKGKFTTTTGLTRGGHPFRYKEVDMHDLLRGRDSSKKKKMHVFMCSYCNKKGSLSNLNLHHKQAHPEKPIKMVGVVTRYECAECQYVALSSGTLKRHFEAEHPNLEFRYMVRTVRKPMVESEKNEELSIEDSPSVHSDSDSLQGVSTNTLSTRPVVPKVDLTTKYVCNWCGETCFSETKMTFHHNMYHSHLEQKFSAEDKDSRESKVTVKVFACPKCSFQVPSMDKMNEHLHKHCRQFKCGYCARLFEFPNHVRNHSNASHQNLPIKIISVKEQESDLSLLRSQVTSVEEEIAPEDYPNFDIPGEHSGDTDMEVAPKRPAVAAFARKSTSMKQRLFPVARKSTNPSPYQFVQRQAALQATVSDSGSSRSQSPSPTEEFSFYGKKVEPLDFKKIRTSVNYGGIHVNVDVANMAQIFNLEPIVLVKDLRNSWK